MAQSLIDQYAFSRRLTRTQMLLLKKSLPPSMFETDEQCDNHKLLLDADPEGIVKHL